MFLFVMNKKPILPFYARKVRGCRKDLKHCFRNDVMKSLFLQGYGSSIKVKDTRLVFSQGIQAFSKEREIIETSVRACNFDKVIIQGDGYVSTKALQILAENNIGVVMLDKRGKLFSYFNETSSSEPLIRQRRYDAFRDEVKADKLRK